MRKKKAKLASEPDSRALRHYPNKAADALAAITPTEPPHAAIVAIQTLGATMTPPDTGNPGSGDPGHDGRHTGEFGGVSLAPALPRGNCVNLLAALVDGLPWGEALKAAGLTWGQVALCRVVDPDGFGRLLDAASRARDGIFRARARDALLQRAVDGVDRPLIGRVGKDLDGVVAVERRYSDRLLEFGLSRLDRETFAEPERGAQQINVGHQVVYNIQGVPMQAAKPPIEAEATETTAEKGENTVALPDLDTD